MFFTVHLPLPTRIFHAKKGSEIRRKRCRSFDIWILTAEAGLVNGWLLSLSLSLYIYIYVWTYTIYIQYRHTIYNMEIWIIYIYIRRLLRTFTIYIQYRHTIYIQYTYNIDIWIIVIINYYLYIYQRIFHDLYNIHTI